MKMKNKNRPQNTLKTFKELFKYFKGYYFVLTLVIIAVIYTSFAQTYGTYMLKDIIKYGIEAKDMNYVIKFTSILGIIYGVGSLSSFFYSTTMVRLSQNVVYKIRKELYRKIIAMPISYFDKNNVGSIMTYFTNDVESMINGLNVSLVNMLFSICNIIGTILGMLFISIELSLIAFVIIGITVFFIYYNAKKCRKYYRKQQDCLSSLNSVIEEDLRGIKVNKAFLHEDKSFVKFDKANKEWKDASTSAFFHSQYNTPFIVSLSYLNFALCTIVGVFFIKNGRLDGIGSLTSFTIFVRQSGQPFNFFTIHLNNLLTMLAGAERIFDFLHKEEENVKDKGTVRLIKKDDSTYYWEKENGELTPLKGDVVFNDVTFGYNKNKIILHNVSFYASRGEKIAFVGSTGAGKTTIISLISRFYDIQSGEITLDGISIYDMKLESLRRATSLVTQDTHIFTDTIYNNIRFPRMHSTKEEVIEASKIGGAYDFIQKLKDKYDTPLYDDAINLSQGERQLVALSRAAISKPPLLILDEATSNIDTRSEKLIEKSMDQLMENRTSLVIAHRLSTVRNATAIIVLDHGRIIERGNHDALIEKKGAYYSLYKGITELS